MSLRLDHVGRHGRRDRARTEQLGHGRPDALDRPVEIAAPCEVGAQGRARAEPGGDLAGVVRVALERHGRDGHDVEPAGAHVAGDLLGVGVPVRDRLEERRDLAREHLLERQPERVREAVRRERVPRREQEAAAGLQDAGDLGIGRGPVGQEHHAEAAHHAVERRVGERQPRGVGDLPRRAGHPRRGPFHHRGVEVGRGDLGVRAGGDELRGHRAGAGRQLQHAPRVPAGGAPGELRREGREHRGDETALVDLGHRTDPPGAVGFHVSVLPARRYGAGPTPV